MKRAIFIITALTACESYAPLCDDYVAHGYGVDGYDVDAVDRDGILVDAPDDFDTANLAKAVDAIDACLAEIGELPFREAEAAWCPFQRYVYQPLRRECFEIKITKSWQLSHDLEWQMLYDEAPWAGCEAKGFEKGPCFWRAAVQHAYQCIAPEVPRMLGGPILQVVTGCVAPYSSPQLARCARITVDWDW